MKQKYLLSMLLGGAMLTACSVDDDLTPAKVAQDANPEAPIFNIGFEADELTRAAFSNGSVVYQDEVIDPETGEVTRKADVMSLYHGVATSWGSYQNAIYKAVGGAEGLEFKTAAMVLDGTAVMVYPADTVSSASAWTGAPVVSIEKEQTQEGMSQRPYVSPILNIADRNASAANKTAGEGVSGYDKKYDIKMKSVAGLLRIGMSADVSAIQAKLDSKGVKATVEIKSVELVNPTALFTTAIPVDEGTPYVTNKAYRKYWSKQTDLNVEGVTTDGQSASLETSYIINQKTACFSLLPFAKDIKEGTDKFKDLKLVVHTTFGDATVDNNSKFEEKDIVTGYTAHHGLGNDDLKGLDKNPVSLAKAFEKGVVKDIYGNSKDGFFKDENAGQIVSLDVHVDMSDVKMNGMHIDNEDDLNIALDVYEALEKDEEVQFILDGHNNGKFEMSKETWQRIADIMNDENSTITFAACNDEEKCSAVVLSTDEESEIPSLKFDSAPKSDSPVKTAVNVELANGTWTFTNASEADKDAKVLKRVQQVIVQKDATLDLTGETYVNVTNNITSKAFEFVNNGTVKINGDVYLMEKMSNNGTIEIGKTEEGLENRFLMYNGGVLTNVEDLATDKKDKFESWWSAAVEGKTLGNAGGVINNAGTLAIVQSTTGEVHNYGTINILNNDARTLITSNGKSVESDPIKKAYRPGETDCNKLGTINLMTQNAGKSKLTINKVTTKGAGSTDEGFVKYSTKTGKPGCEYANYVVVEGNKIEDNHKGMKYIEIKNDGTEIEIENAVSTNALIIPKGKSIFIPNSTSASVKVSKYLYLKGSITRAGSLTGETGVKFEEGSEVFEGYFGGDKTKDWKTIYSDK